MTMLPDFKLETHFSKWEFQARYHMTASDAESMSMRMESLIWWGITETGTLIPIDGNTTRADHSFRQFQVSEHLVSAVSSQVTDPKNIRVSAPGR